MEIEETMKNMQKSVKILMISIVKFANKYYNRNVCFGMM